MTEALEYSLLDEMQSLWGSRLEALNDSQRCWMIYMLAYDLQEEFEEDHHLDNEVEEITQRFDEFSIEQKIGLIETLINQVKAIS